MAPAGFEPEIPASEGLQTHYLDQAASRIIKIFSYFSEIKPILKKYNEDVCVDI